MRPSVITISRQFGSGGRQVGAELAQRLGVPFYDKALFEEAAKRSGIHPEHFAQAEQQRGRLFAYLFQNNAAGSFELSLEDKIFLEQAKTIQKLAQEGPCILVGRGANRILEKRGDVLNIFLYAPRDMRLKRITQVYHVPEEQAEKALRDTDRDRAAYLKTYTGQVFGQVENYHLCLDSGTLGIENTVKIIEAVYKAL